MFLDGRMKAKNAKSVRYYALKFLYALSSQYDPSSETANDIITAALHCYMALQVSDIKGSMHFKYNKQEIVDIF